MAGSGPTPRAHELAHDCGRTMARMTQALALDLHRRRGWRVDSLELADSLGGDWYCESCNQIVTSNGLSFGC